MLLPVALFYLLFHYGPMYGVQLAFKDFKALLGIAGSPWAGLKYFNQFFNSPFFSRVVTNTVTISGLSLLFGFPVPILLALMLNEVKGSAYKKTVQNVTYIPHFLSTVVLVGLIRSFTNNDYGIVNILIRALGGQGTNWLQRVDWFRRLYVGSSIWQNAGWDSIIYIAALSGVDPQLHESARMDGANRFQCVWHINIPGITPTIVILLILNSGHIMSVGFEKAFLMQNDLNLAVSDIIATYAYRIGIETSQFSLSTAIGLFNSVINCTLLLLVNAISRRVGETSLW